MTMREYCKTCAKESVCCFTDVMTAFVDDVNEQFETRFSGSRESELLTLDFRCREYLKYVEQRSPGICP